MSSNIAKKRKVGETTTPYVPLEYQPPQQQQEDEQIPEEQENHYQEQQQQEDEEDEEEDNNNMEEEDHNQNGNTHKQQHYEEEEPVEKLLEPFGKEQLILLVKEAVGKHSDIMEIVQNLADADPAHRKIFVHGLGWDTTVETLISVFQKYGNIEDCKVVVDKISGKSKGYAFILFKHRAGAKKALREPQKKIGTRVTSCQLASAGPVPVQPPVSSAPPVSEYTQRKIFVSNVGADVDPKKLVDFFNQFGEVEEGPLGIDKQTGKFKGFCLFVYKSVGGAKKALEEPHKPFEGSTLHCQKAVDGPKHSKPQHQQNLQSPGFRKERRPSYGGGADGDMMALSGPSSGYNLGGAAPNLAPVLGQALALLAGQGGAGIGNLLGGLGGGQPNQGYNQGYNQQGGGYGAPQPGMQGGGYQNPQMGGRPPYGGAPYMGHGR